MSEIKISEEALLCSHREESHSHPHGYHVQMLLNQRDAELAELRKDKERLDAWEQSQKYELDGYQTKDGFVWKFGDRYDIRIPYRKSLREAIDAMTASQAGVKGGEK